MEEFDIRIDVDEILRSLQLEAILIRAATEITSRAQTYTGVWTDALRQSMSYTIKYNEAGHKIAVLGSNAESGDPVFYAAPHWADVKDPNDLKRPVGYVYEPPWQDHPGKKSQPTEPYTHALVELGIPFVIETGGFSS